MGSSHRVADSRPRQSGRPDRPLRGVKGGKAGARRLPRSGPSTQLRQPTRDRHHSNDGLPPAVRAGAEGRAGPWLWPDALRTRHQRVGGGAVPVSGAGRRECPHRASSDDKPGAPAQHVSPEQQRGRPKIARLALLHHGPGGMPGAVVHGGCCRFAGQGRVEEFPPEALLEDLQWEPGEIAVVLPAKTSSMDLGLLTLITPTDVTRIKGYDRLFEEGALLTVALEREVMTERLRRSNADLATFSRAMAHDLRNPLATIVMWASVARSQAGPGNDATPVLQIVEQIKEVADGANDLVTDLLHYVELDREPTALESVDLNLAAARALASNGSMVAEHGATMETGEIGRAHV